MSSRGPVELPFFFGERGEVFGLYHPAAPGHAPSRVMLLCPPLGQDQIRCHRLYRQMADALAADGVPALRFDYYGCGDSAGDSRDVRWDRCIDDIVVAAEELRSRAGLHEVAAFGARLGGSLALKAATRAGFEDVIVWDAVVDGADYVRSLESMQESLRQDSRRFVHPRKAEEVEGQWLGFEADPALQAQVRGMALSRDALPSLWIDTADAEEKQGWRSLALDAGRVRTLETKTPWDDLGRLETAILSHGVVQAVASHLREVA
jgi:pimeloyl-ACP methyl ester carboxylesterase